MPDDSASEIVRVQAMSDVMKERHRQVSVEGHGPTKDDGFTDHQLRSAAVAYVGAHVPSGPPSADPPPWWPWAAAHWKPTTDRRCLVKAAALIVAEIERIDRAAIFDRPLPETVFDPIKGDGQ